MRGSQYHAADSHGVAEGPGVGVAVTVDVGVSATGIAGPEGGTASKPVGLTYVGISSPLGESAEQNTWPHDRSGNKWATADAALRLLMRHLSEGHAAGSTAQSDSSSSD